MALLLTSGCEKDSGKPADSSDVNSVVSTDMTSSAEEESIDPSKLTTFAEKSRIMYDGHVINVGDKIDDVFKRLGNPAAPSANVPSCITKDTVTENYYPYMTIQSANGIIFCIEIATMAIPVSKNRLPLWASVSAIPENKRFLFTARNC